ncbi:MAG: subclass B1 metallo-beta-lactamase [bacterium]
MILFLSIGIASSQVHATKQGINLREDVIVREFKPGVWLYTAYYDLPDLKHCPANGLIIIDQDKAMLINVPWTNEQAGVLFDWVANQHKAKVQMVVPTHAHIDCIGGLAESHRRGAVSYAFSSTVVLQEKVHQIEPMNSFSQKTALYCGKIKVDLIYPGPGHTQDNIVAWIPNNRILFAGCLVKSMDAKKLGNIKESDLKNYPRTLENIRKLYSNAEIVIPGHGQPGGIELIQHTIDLCKDRN